MRAVVLDSERGAAEATIRALKDAGWQVGRCSERGLPAFPCAGMTDTCPLEADHPIDVVVTVRPHVLTVISPREHGVLCALRAGTPLVVVGRGATFHPFEHWDPVLADRPEDVPSACAEAVHLSARRRPLS